MSMRAFGIGSVLVALGCGSPVTPSVYFIAGTGDGRDPVVAVNFTGQYHACPNPAEWQVVAWPELVVLSSTPVGPADVRPDYGACQLTLDVSEELVEAWYAVRYIGPSTNPRDFMGGFPLSDGTRVFPFMGVAPVVIQSVVVSTIDPTSGDAARVAANPTSYGLETAPGRTWSSTMRVTQGELSCSSPIEGRGLEVTCEGFDWAQPVSIVIDGLVNSFGSHLPVPTVDVSYAFGPLPEGNPAVLILDDGWNEPPFVPTALCAGEYCEP